MKSLFKLTDYYLFTFKTTSYALKAEKVLKKANSEFVVIPTLREISTSCGLSIKVSLEKCDETNQLLIANQVPIDSIYKVEKQGRKNVVEELVLN